MFDNPYSPPQSHSVAKSRRADWAGSLFGWAGCLLILSVIMRQGDKALFLTYFMVTATIFGLAHFLLPFRKTAKSRAAIISLCGAISGAVCGTLYSFACYVVDGGFAYPIQRIRFLITITFATMFSICGSCMGLGLVRLFDGSLNSTANRRITKN